jgi:hypothetical protein
MGRGYRLTDLHVAQFGIQTDDLSITVRKRRRLVRAISKVAMRPCDILKSLFAAPDVPDKALRKVSRFCFNNFSVTAPKRNHETPVR